MDDLKYLLQEFRNSEFDKKHKEKTMSISNEKDIQYVVMKKAYRDMKMQQLMRIKEMRFWNGSLANL